MPKGNSDVFKLRKGIFESFDTFMGKIMDFTVSEMSLRADKLCAPENNRIGVFGYYPGRGKKVIMEVAHHISSSGCGIISGLGFFAPNKPNELHKINDLLSSLAERALEYFEVPDYIRYRHLPRITCKAVHHLTTVRGQGNEAEGCYSYSIPMMGFVIDKRVSSLSRQSKRCNYLNQQKSNWECFAPGKGFCFHPSLKPVCPFYDYVDIPWDVKQLFLEPSNRLIACSSLNDVKTSITECLKTKFTKPTARSS